MKKNSFRLWMLNAILVCALGVFTACSSDDDDNPVQPGKEYSSTTRELISLVDNNAELKSLLKKAIAKGAEMNPDKKTNPAQTLSEYYDFVEWAAHAMPWTVIYQPEGTDLFTRIDQSLNYFFFINDIPLEELDGKSLYNNSLQYYEPYRSWLKSFAKAWGAYLDTEDSWKQEYFDEVARVDTFGISKGWYEDASNWKTFNQFFARRLKSPDMRPIASPDDGAVVVSPADACTQGVWQIDDEGYIVQNHESGVQIKSKKFSSIAELVGPDSQYRNAFNGGTLTHSFLNVYDYHRYHFPLAGKIKEGEYLPSIRGLAQELRISVITTMKAYEELAAEGLVTAVQGKGFLVNAQDSELLKEQHMRRVEEALTEAIKASKIAGMSDKELRETLKTLQAIMNE